jgi:hypothetical protein
MKDGYEDWDFWLQCMSNGFRNTKYLPSINYRYRIRPSSMVADSTTKHASIVDKLQRKHNALTTKRSGLMEHDSGSAQFLIITEAGCYFLDNADTITCLLSYENIAELFWRWQFTGRQYEFPNSAIFLNESLFQTLCNENLLNTLLWHSAHQVPSPQLVGIEIESHSHVSSADDQYLSLKCEGNIVASEAALSCSILHIRMAVFAEIINELMCSQRKIIENATFLQTLQSKIKIGKVAKLIFGPSFRGGSLSVLSGNTILERFHASVCSADYDFKQIEYWAKQNATFSMSRLSCRPIRPSGRFLQGFTGASDGQSKRITVLWRAKYGIEIDESLVDICQRISSDNYILRLLVIQENPSDVVCFRKDSFADCGIIRGSFHSVTENTGSLRIGSTQPSQATIDDITDYCIDADAVLIFQSHHMLSLLPFFKSGGFKTFIMLQKITFESPGMPNEDFFSVMSYEHACSRIYIESVYDRLWLGAFGIPHEKIYAI